MPKQPNGKRLFVVDTNVLMHDPTALFRFEEHDVFLPMVVLEELDKAKKGVSEVARNVRQVSRFLDMLSHDADHDQIQAGLRISNGSLPHAQWSPSGRLFLETDLEPAALPETLRRNSNDNVILSTALALQQKRTETKVTLVSKDINLRIKATITGIHSEDYRNDRVLDDVDLLYLGVAELPADFQDTHSHDIDSWQDQGVTYYQVRGPLVQQWQPNQFVYLDGEGSFDAIVKNIDAGSATLALTTNYSQPNHTVWGINARNREQNFALNLLMDPHIDFVSMLGVAGTGKTLLALAAGLVQTLESKLYREIIMTRVTVPVGEDIGFLPGTEEEKMTPWMGALMDNLEVLTQTEDGGDWGRAATNDLINSRIKIRSLNFMRGRTFLNRFIILDEAQNLTPKQLKTLITRAGPGSKIVCLGNTAQIDTPYLTETSSGLTYVVDHFKDWAHSGHITLLRGERSRLADYASEML